MDDVEEAPSLSEAPPAPNNGGAKPEEEGTAVEVSPSPPAPPLLGAGGATPEPPSLETAGSWLAKIKSPAIMALLREPDFALVSMTAFAGFRVNATSYANPLVRRRLAQEAIRDSKFADKLRELADAAPSPAFGHPSPLRTGDSESGSGEGPVASGPAAPHQPEGQLPEAQPGRYKPFSHSDGGKVAKPDRGLKASRERDEARQALADAEAARAEATRLQQRAETERDEAGQQSQKQAQRIARLERQLAKLQKEQADLLRALKEAAPTSETVREDRKAPTPMQEDRGGVPLRPDLWREAVAHLLDKPRPELALGLAEDVLRAAPDDADALDIAARAYVALGDGRAAIPLVRRLLASALAQRRMGDAGEALVRLLLLVSPTQAERDVRGFLHALRPDDARAMEQARALLARLRGLAPERHRALAAQISQLASPALAQALMPPPGQIGPDDPLPLGLAPDVSAGRVLLAVNAGETELVNRAREALAQVCAADPDTGRRVWEALERASEGDPSALVPLRGGRGRGAVVVDGSNAAWHDQESLAAGRPRLRPLLALRRTLRLRGYFPVVLYADAPLPYTVDDPAALRGMVARRELTLVDSGVDADEVLLREAKRLSAPLITNDYMADWDPLGEVLKIRYTLSLSGEAVLLSE